MKDFIPISIKPKYFLLAVLIPLVYLFFCRYHVKYLQQSIPALWDVVFISSYLLWFAGYWCYQQVVIKNINNQLNKVTKITLKGFELSEVLIRAKENNILQELLSHAVDLIPNAEMGSVIFVDGKQAKHKTRLRYEACYNLDLKELNEHKLTLDETYFHAYTDGLYNRPIIIENIQQDKKSKAIYLKQERINKINNYKIKSSLTIPFHIDGQLYGMLNLDSSQSYAFTHDDFNLALILTHQLNHIIKMREQAKEIAFLTDYDHLTNLLNRRAFMEKRALLKQDKYHAQLLIIDMNNLKKLNDQHGHLIGDEALVTLAKTIKSFWAEDSICARFGGDEFAILTSCKSEAIEQRLQAMRQCLTVHHYPICFSVGISAYVQDWKTTLHAADQAMYQNKLQCKQAEA